MTKTLRSHFGSSLIHLRWVGWWAGYYRRLGSGHSCLSASLQFGHLSLVTLPRHNHSRGHCYCCILFISVGLLPSEVDKGFIGLSLAASTAAFFSSPLGRSHPRWTKALLAYWNWEIFRDFYIFFWHSGSVRIYFNGTSCGYRQ